MKVYKMKTLLLAGAAIMVATTATADPLSDFRSNGEIGGFLDLDFAMQNELNSSNAIVMDKMDKKMDAGIAGVASLAMLPEGDGVLGMGISKHSSGEALAVGYSKTLAAKYLTRVGLSYNSEHDMTVGAGLGYKF